MDDRSAFPSQRGPLEIDPGRKASAEEPVQPPAEIAGLRLFAIAASKDPEAVPSLVFKLEIVAHRIAFAVASPPFAEDPLRTVSAPDTVADAAPTEGDWRLVGHCLLYTSDAADE